MYLNKLDIKLLKILNLISLSLSLSKTLNSHEMFQNISRRPLVPRHPTYSVLAMNQFTGLKLFRIQFEATHGSGLNQIKSNQIWIGFELIQYVNHTYMWLAFLQSYSIARSFLSLLSDVMLFINQCHDTFGIALNIKQNVDMLSLGKLP